MNENQKNIIQYAVDLIRDRSNVEKQRVVIAHRDFLILQYLALGQFNELYVNVDNETDQELYILEDLIVDKNKLENGEEVSLLSEM
jgi:hypothetical protein